MNPLTAIRGILGAIERPLAEVIPDVDLRRKLEAQIHAAVLSNDKVMTELSKAIVNIESTSDNWLSKNYRPIIGLWAMALATAGLFGFIPSMTPDLLERLITGAFALAGLFTLARSADKFTRGQVLKQQMDSETYRRG